MLWFQVGAIDLNRPGTKLRSRERAVRVNHPYLTSNFNVGAISGDQGLIV